MPFHSAQRILQYYQIGKIKRPTFIEIEEGQIIKCGDIEIEVVSASHTCFDSFGFIIKHVLSLNSSFIDSKLTLESFPPPTAIKLPIPL